MRQKEKMLATKISLFLKTICYLFFSHSFYKEQDLSLKVSLTKIVTFAASVDQDQAAQTVQPDLRSTLSAMLELERKKRTQNLPLYLPHCTIKICTRFILRFNG